MTLCDENRLYIMPVRFIPTTAYHAAYTQPWLISVCSLNAGFKSQSDNKVNNKTETKQKMKAQ